MPLKAVCEMLSQIQSRCAILLRQLRVGGSRQVVVPGELVYSPLTQISKILSLIINSQKRRVVFLSEAFFATKESRQNTFFCLPWLICSILMQSVSIPQFWKLKRFQEYPVVVEQLVLKNDFASFLRHQLLEQSKAELSYWQSLRKSAMSDMVQSSTLLQSTLSRVRLGSKLMKLLRQRSTSPQAELLLSLAYSLCWQSSSSLVSMKVLQSSPGDPISESFPSTERAKGTHSKGKTLSQKEMSSFVKASRSVVTAHRQLTSNSTISQSSKRELI